MNKLIKLLVLGLLITASSLSYAYMCGVKPVPPVGCDYVCICDNLGMNCSWIAVCQ